MVHDIQGKLIQMSEKHMSIRVGAKWFPCSLNMYNNIVKGPWQIGDTVGIDLDSSGQVKSIRTVSTSRSPEEGKIR